MLWNSRLDDITNRPKQALNNWEIPPSTAEPQVSQLSDSRIRRFLAHSSTTLFQDTHKPPNCLKRKHKNSPETWNEDNTYLSRFFRRRYQWGIPSFTTVISTRPIKQKREQNNLISAMPQSEAQNWREPRSTRKAYNTNWNRTSVTSLPCAKETNPTTNQPKMPSHQLLLLPQTAARNATPGNHLDTRNLGVKKKQWSTRGNLEKSCERTSQTMHVSNLRSPAPRSPGIRRRIGPCKAELDAICGLLELGGGESTIVET